MKSYYRFVGIFLLTLIISTAALGQKPKQIVIVNSDTASVNEILRPGIEKLVGHVILKHDSAYMFCDSAFYNSKQQNFKAFGRVHVQSPTEDMLDTVNLWGDSLNYSGRDKVARVRSNVILQKDSLYLYTENLDYNISEDIGNYFDGGRTLNGEDTLVSRLGYYYANEDEIFFKDSVKIFNPKYTMYSDTLKHHTKKKISYILGPTNIISTDTTGSFLYCENGWYDHNRDVAQFNKNALMVHGSQTLKGDSLYYDRKRGIGRAYNNVEAIDSTQSALLLGNFGEYHEKTERTIMTNQAQFIQIQDKDSLYLHADTIMSIKDSLITKSDSSYFSIIKAFHKVKIFKSDFQAKCDSLVYTLLDSTIELHKQPVMWSGKYQITAKFIKIFTENQEVNEVKMYENSLIVAKSDTIRFDQVRGENMIAYVDSGKLTRIEVKKDGATIYIAKEKEKLMGVNKITCVDMTIYMANNELDRIKFYQTPDGTLYPPYYLKEEELKFDNFQWNENLRPKSKEDIFIWIVQEETNSDAKGKDKKTKSSDKSTKRSDMEIDRPARLNKGKK